MTHNARRIVVALGAGVAAVALAVGGAFPATATPDVASASDSTDDSTLVAADCDTFETACPWDLTSLSVSPVGLGLVYLAFTAPSSGPFLLSSSNGTSGGDPHGFLYDSARHLIAYDDDSAGNLNFLILADLVEGEEYFLAVRHHSSSSSGSFTVNFAEADPCSTLAAACLWDLTPRAVTFTGRSRVYLRFIAPATDGFRITASGQGTSYVDAWLVDDQGNTITQRNGLLPNGQPFFTLDLTQDQAYLLILDQWYSSGNASLTISFGTADPCETLGTACAWDLSPTTVSPAANASNYLVFTAPESASYVFVSSDRSSSSDPYARLMSADGQTIASNDDGAGDLNFRIRADLVAGLTYYLVLTLRGSGQSGSFTVSSVDPPPCTSLAAACLWDLSPTAVTLAHDDVFLEFVAPRSGGFVFISSDLNMYSYPSAYLLNASGQTIASGYGYSSSDSNFRIRADLVAGRTYYLVLSMYWSGQSGSLIVSSVDPPPCTSLTAACSWDLSPAVVTPVYDDEVFLEFVAPRSGSYVFISADRSNSSDPYARLLGANGQTIASNDDGAGDRNFKITANLVAGQTYYLAVSQYRWGATGPFTVFATGPGLPNAFLSPSDWAPGPAFHTLLVTVRVVDGASWAAYTNAPWLSVVADGPTMIVAAETNPGSTRTGTVTVAAGGRSTTFTVNQAGTAVTPSPPTTITPRPSPPAPSDGTTNGTKPLAEKIKAGVVKITGKLKVGKTLKAKVTKFTKGVAYSYTWYRNGAKIKGATKASYTLKKADRGKKIKVTVTAKKTGMLPASATSKVVKVSKK